MKTKLLVVVAVVFLLVTKSVHATYSYYYTENLASPTWGNWTVTGTLSSQNYSAGGYGGLAGSGGSMMYHTANYGGGEIAMTIRGAGGDGSFFTAYMASADAALANQTYDYVIVQGGSGGGIFAGQAYNGVSAAESEVSVPVPDGSVVRAVAIPSATGDTIVVYVNNVLVIEAAAPNPLTSYSSYWGVGAYTPSLTDGSLMQSVSLGYQDITAPNPVSYVGTSPSYSNVFLQWSPTTDNVGGTGVYDYTIYRNGQPIYSTQSTYYNDTGVVPDTTYTYTIAATDYHLNSASSAPKAATTKSIGTNPPYPSTTPSGRRTGVRPTGAYWGASGENIDVLTGNLSFAQPLLSAQGRDGWSVPFNLVYNSQNWGYASSMVLPFGVDSGYGFGWKVMAGSITPVWNAGGLSASQYIFTDATGAEYHLNQQNGNIWTSQESIYVWFDGNANVLHNRDGSFWTFGCISASTEPDSGVMYPTAIEDSNGNQVLIRYHSAQGASWTNSSSRISQIEDERASYEGPNTYYTYAFNYNTDSPPHLTSITNTIGTGEAYTFEYNEGQTLYDPFVDQAQGTTAFLHSATITGIGTSYQFTTNSFGEVTQIQLPYKGTLQYAYTTTAYGDGQSWRELTTRTLSTCNSASQGCESGSGQYTISHESSPGYDVHQFTLIEDPGGVGEKYWAFNSSGAYEGLTTTYQGRDRNAGGPGNCLSGNTTGSGQCKVENDYTWTQDSTGNSSIGQVLNTLDPGQSYAAQNSTSQTMDIYGNVLRVVSHNFSGYSPSARTSTYTYLNNSNYTSQYIYNRLVSAAETDGTTNLTLAINTYDCGTFGCGGLTTYNPNPREWDTNYANVRYRGIPTTTVTLSGTTTASYDMYGDVTSGTNNNGVSASSTLTSATNYAAPTAITVGSNLTTSLSYEAFLGLSSATGPNGATVDIGYDANARPTSGKSPFGAVTTITYNDTASTPSSCSIVSDDGGSGRWTQTNLDGLGRPILSLTGYGSSCGSGTPLTQAETTYAPCGCTPVGKMVSQAVPHTYGSSPSASTTYTYDGVGRTLSKAVVGPDTQGTTTYAYTGNKVRVQDPASKTKDFITDAFGNLTQVIEDPSIPPSYTGLNYTTSYTYDVLNHLINVSMPRSTGTQTRSWSYSGAFLMSATNPENGTVSYTYGSNQKVATRTDAKGQVTVYSYNDPLARLTEVQHYPNGISGGEAVCQQVDYYYDGNNPLGPSNPLALGMLSAIQYYSPVAVPNANANPSCYTTFTEMYTYGGAGAPTGKQLTVTRNYEEYPGEEGNLSVNLTAGYSYDMEGRLTSETYPTDGSGATQNLSYTFDSMGRLNTMTDNIAGSQIISSATYGPANELLSLSGGTWGSTYPGIGGYEARTYNSLKQLTNISIYGEMNTSYIYPSTGNNGKISSQTDAISGETVAYSYDALNRLATANNSGASPSWGQSFGYDGFGNLTQTSVTQGSAPTFSKTYDSNNHGGGEDANGNPSSVYLPADSQSVPASYDVENRLATLQAVGTSYGYDPANHRVWRYIPSSNTDEITFWGINGQKLGTYQLSFMQGVVNQYPPSFSCTQTTTNLYFGARLIKNNNGWVYPDRLGSIGKFYPYGMERPSATTNGTEKFTGYFRDSETGNDYAVNRYQSPGYGRFLTPDKVDGHSSDPGSWNKYAYTRGDPVNRVDPAGMFGEDPDCIGDICPLIDSEEEDTTGIGAFCLSYAGYLLSTGVSCQDFLSTCAAASQNGFQSVDPTTEGICGVAVQAGALQQQAPPPPCNTDIPKITTTLQNLESDILGITAQMDAAITPTDLSALQSTLSADVTQELNNPTSFFKGGHFFLVLSLVSVASDFGGSSTGAYTDFLALFDPAGNGRRYPSPVPTTDPSHTYYLHDHSADDDLDLTFHFDRYNPYHDFPIGTLQHFGVDVLYGSLGVHCLDPAWRN